MQPVEHPMSQVRGSSLEPGCGGTGTAERSYPVSEVSDLPEETPRLRSGVARRRPPRVPEARSVDLEEPP